MNRKASCRESDPEMTTTAVTTMETATATVTEATAETETTTAMTMLVRVMIVMVVIAGTWFWKSEWRPGLPQPSPMLWTLRAACAELASYSQKSWSILMARVF
jgi:hypothetical protein